MDMNSPLQEDKGLVKIHSICTQMDAIWRPTPCHDIGIDGQIEFLEPGTSISNGNIISVQSKSGPCYFKNQDDTHIFFYPEKNHRRYWRVLKMPIILILYNPENDLALFANIKNQMLANGPILISKRDIFTSKCRDNLIFMSEEYFDDIFDPHKILSGFMKIKCNREDDKVITGIDFLLASTNRDAHYFEIRMCRYKALFSLVSQGGGITINQDDYDYILRCVLKVHENKLVENFLADFDEMWFDLSTVPDILVSLTKTGIEVMETLWSNPDEYISKDAYLHHAGYSSQDLAKTISYYAQKESDRLDASDRIGLEPR